MKYLPFLALKHVVLALAFQLLANRVGGLPLLYGGLMAQAWFVSREWSEAEYRYIFHFTHEQTREEMPWWGPLDKRVWLISPKSFSDFLMPIFVTSAVTYWPQLVSLFYTGHM